MLRGLTAVLALLLLVWAAGTADADAEHQVRFENGRVYMDGKPVPEYDYTWHADPSAVRSVPGDVPAEYYTGTEPSGEDAVYIAHDIAYFPEVAADRFRMEEMLTGMPLTEPSRAYYDITGEKGEPSGGFIPDGPVSYFVDIEDSAGDVSGNSNAAPSCSGES